MNDLSLDYFIDENLKLYQKKDCFHFNTDTKFLAQFVHLHSNETILDIGTNNGALLLYMDQFNVQKLIGVEILKEAFEVCKLNEQFIKHPCEFYNEDIRLFEHEKVDVILCNPPYFPVSKTNPNVILDNRQLGRIEINLTFKECVESVNRLLKDNGRFYFVHRCTFLNEILEVLSLYHFHIKTMQIAYDKKSMQAKSFCMEVIRDSKCQCKILPVKWI